MRYCGNCQTWQPSWAEIYNNYNYSDNHCAVCNHPFQPDQLQPLSPLLVRPPFIHPHFISQFILPLQLVNQQIQQNFSNWASGNPVIDKFIQESQLEAINNLSRRIIEWIPYDRFTNIEFLAKGGFGKIYKAEWIDGPIVRWNTSEFERNKFKKVALKILNNSQGVKTDFLKEVFYHRILDDSSCIVSCYGISQEPQTRNYVMVMRYAEQGSLKRYLQVNYNKLDFASKLCKLISVAKGLN